MSDTVEFDKTPRAYDFDLTVDAQLNRIHDLYGLIRDEGYAAFIFGDSRIPEVVCTSYEQAGRIRRALAMEDVVKHNCEHSINYAGTSNGHKVIVSINRSSVCEIVYVEEEVTELVPDPDIVVPMIPWTRIKTRTTYNCAGLEDSDE